MVIKAMVFTYFDEGDHVMKVGMGMVMLTAMWPFEGMRLVLDTHHGLSL